MFLYKNTKRKGMNRIVKWLHLSDLHIRDNVDWNIYVKDLTELCRKNKSIDFVIVTGDFHNYSDQSDFSKSISFLKNIMLELGLDINNDLFLVPGNHDGSFPVDKYKEAFTEHIKSNYANINLKEWERLVSQFNAYEKFVHDLIKDYPVEHPARVHCRTWRNKINFIHLNSAVVADGKSKEKQMVDIEAMAKLKLSKHIPTIILAHNHFNDLHKEQQKRMRGIMRNEYICGYFCGDRHIQEVNQITLRRGQNQQIPCVVSYKSAADIADEFSVYGVIIGSWVSEKAELKGWIWEPENGFQVDSKITDQIIEMKKPYENIKLKSFELSSSNYDIKNDKKIIKQENYIKALKIEECTKISKEQEKLFRKYYYNMSYNQIDIFNNRYSYKIRELTKEESNEKLNEYIMTAYQKGCLTEILDYMNNIFKKYLTDEKKKG